MSSHLLTERERLYRQALGALLRARRLEAGLSQADAAAKSGITQVSISNYERGERTPPAYLLAGLEEALGVGAGTIHVAAWRASAAAAVEGRAA